MSEPNPLGLEPGAWQPPGDEKARPATAGELDTDADYEVPPPELLDWTPERAAALVKGAGYLLHAADPLSQEQGGDLLWRATQTDADDIGAPLSRILNRYALARRLAGVADEGELAFAMIAYAKRNLRTRGQLVAVVREREAAAAAVPTVGWPERTEPEAA